MAFRSVEDLLAPRSIAIVGAHSDPSDWGMRVARALRRREYEGRLTLVSPTLDPIEGWSTARSLKDLTEAADHIVALVSATRTVELLAEAGALGARSATVLTAGFDELGTDEGRALANSLREIANRYEMAICGPNCMGFMSLGSKVSTFAERNPTEIRKGGLGLISQSGGMMGGILQHASQRRLGLSQAISTGNELNRDAADFLHFMASDPQTSAVGLVLEGVRRPEEFAAACEEMLAAGKPVILLQSGRTERGQAAVRSHTGVLAATGATMDAVIDQLNIIRVDSIAELIETAEASTKLAAPKSIGLGVVALSGGARNMIIDLEDDFDLPFAELSQGTLTELDRILPPVGTKVDNPLDIGIVGIASGLRGTYLEALNVVLSDPAVGVLAIQDELPGQAAPPTQLAGLAEVCDLSKRYGKQVVFFSRANYALGESEHEALESLPAPFLQDVHNSMKALGRFLRYQAKRERCLALPKLSEAIAARDRRDDAGEGQAVSTITAFQALERHGVPVSAYAVMKPGERRASDYSGRWPVALKVIADGVEHKTDIGGVTLNIGSPEDLEVQASAMRRRVGKHHPILVQEMVGSALLEIFVSCYRDERFDWVLLIGIGGLWAEPLASISSFILPRSAQEVRGAVDGSIVGKILRSARGRRILPAEDIYAAIGAICQTAVDPALALSRLEVNPLLVGAAGCTAVDIVMESDATRVGEQGKVAS